MWCEYELSTSTKTWRWRIALDPPTRLPILGQAVATMLPSWTALGVCRCPGCPLPDDDSAPCPAAVAVADVVGAVSDIASIDEVDVVVTMAERIIKKRTTGAAAARSVMGLLMATSGCPVLEVMRPLARHHLPFASEEEWLFRLVGLHLLKSWFAAQDGGVGDVSLQALPAYLRQLKELNTAFAARMRTACDKDAVPNAIAQLFSFSVGAGFDVDEGLGSLRVFLR